MDGLVSAKVFDNRLAAEIAKGLLDSRGIPSLVRADDAGGMRPPPFQFVWGVELMVRETDLARARRLLAES